MYAHADTQLRINYCNWIEYAAWIGPEMKKPHSERRKSAQRRVKPLTPVFNPADSAIIKRLDDIEARLRILENQIASPFLSYQSNSILHPQKPAGRRPALDNSWLLSMRERIIQALEPRWPELAGGIFGAKTRAQLRTALQPLSNAHDPTLDLIVKHAAILWDFLQSDRFRKEPDHKRLRVALILPKSATHGDLCRMIDAVACLPTRQIAAALAGPLAVPGRMAWRTSLARCGKMRQLLSGDFFLAMREYYGHKINQNMRMEDRSMK